MPEISPLGWFSHHSWDHRAAQRHLHAVQVQGNQAREQVRADLPRRDADHSSNGACHIFNTASRVPAICLPLLHCWH